MNNWIKIEDKQPKEKQDVWYYFKPCGIFKGKYIKEEYVTYDNEIDYHDIFYGKSGFLTDDVTHWMPYKENDKEPIAPNIENE